ncbi:MAG TPA: rRNA maturation RNase YbeY [Candidatus Acidoferrales bacterium]|nr:rRNA maturation RNase YbeY [Candidatus Acidoferrales bacterium]
MAVHVRSESADPQVSLARVRRQAQTILARLGEARSELSVLFVNNDAMRALNQRFRGKNAPTDVLSFPLDERLPGGGKLLGDVVISLEQAQKQARAKRNRLNREVDWLLTHGILHLLGYDHERSRKDERIMRSLERRLLAALSRKRACRL